MQIKVKVNLDNHRKCSIQCDNDGNHARAHVHIHIDVHHGYEAP